MKNKLKNAVNEKDVENIYREELKRFFRKNVEVVSPYGCDGLLKTRDLRTLLEFKYDLDLKSKVMQCNILVQMLYYLKKFENDGKVLPNTLFVGDKNECFALHTNAIVNYLSSEIDWKIAPSEAYKRNVNLVQAMVDDVNILPFVYDIDENFDIRVVIGKIKELSENVVKKVRIVESNLEAIFDYFNKNIVGDKSELKINERVNLFIQILINPENNYLHPRKKNILTTESFGDVPVNGNLFKSFFSHFEGEKYSPKDKEKLTGICDRLIEDTTRRNKGEFYTPTAFVDLAHKYISEVFGENWKEKFVVWDCASGTGNLTRDYKFRELYCSTLEKSDIDTMNQMGYNKEATKFQFDFLNDGDEGLPEKLKKAIIEGKEILFLINPPYASQAGFSDKTKDKCTKTVINLEMIKNNLGKSCQNLYSQFLYKIIKYQEKNKNIKIGIFCPPLFLSGQDFSSFRNIFLKKFFYENGFVFQASHFSNVAKAWGISFSIFSNKKNNDNNNFYFNIVDINEMFEIEKVEIKNIYNTIDLASKWIRLEIKNVKTFDVPQFSSSLKIKNNGCGSNTINGIGYFYNNSNNIEKNPINVGLFSSTFSNGHGVSIIKENFNKVCNLFTARKSIQSTWVNCKDEYIAPNEQHRSYEQFSYDAIVYSLFNGSSHQSSLRQVEYKGKKWDIKNEFFWMSKDEMLKLANKNNYDELYKDAKTADERFVYKKLFQEGIYEKLSEDAKEVLNIATELLRKSISERKLLSEEHPEYHLGAWDAGYAQMKLVWKEYFKDEFEKFRKKYKEFEDRLRPMVYELGFLRK